MKRWMGAIAGLALVTAGISGCGDEEPASEQASTPTPVVTAPHVDLTFRILADGSAAGGSMPDVAGAWTAEQALQWAKSPASAWTAALKTAICKPDAPGVALVPPFVNTLPWDSSMTEADLTKALAPFEKELTTVPSEIADALKKNPEDTSAAAALEKRRVGLYAVPADAEDRPLIVCNDQGQVSLLSPAVISGDQITSASAAAVFPGWVVNLTFDDEGADTFEDLSRHMVPGGDHAGMQFAIVLDGRLLSAPGFSDVVTSGQAQVAGNFTEDEAKNLAASLTSVR